MGQKAATEQNDGLYVLATERSGCGDLTTKILSLGILGLETQLVASHPKPLDVDPVVYCYTIGEAYYQYFRNVPYLHLWGLHKAK
jgi:hypothetical protein